MSENNIDIALIKAKLVGMEKKTDTLISQNQLMIASLDKLSIQINELFKVKIEEETKLEEKQKIAIEDQKKAERELIWRRLNDQATDWGEFGSSPEFPNFEMLWKAKTMKDLLKSKDDQRAETYSPEELHQMYDHFIEFVPNSDGYKGIWKKKKPNR